MPSRVSPGGLQPPRAVPCRTDPCRAEPIRAAGRAFSSSPAGARALDIVSSSRRKGPPRPSTMCSSRRGSPRPPPGAPAPRGPRSPSPRPLRPLPGPARPPPPPRLPPASPAAPPREPGVTRSAAPAPLPGQQLVVSLSGAPSPGPLPPSLRPSAPRSQPRRRAGAGRQAPGPAPGKHSPAGLRYRPPQYRGTGAGGGMRGASTRRRGGEGRGGGALAGGAAGPGPNSGGSGRPAPLPREVAGRPAGGGREGKVGGWEGGWEVGASFPAPGAAPPSPEEHKSEEESGRRRRWGELRPPSIPGHRPRAAAIASPAPGGDCAGNSRLPGGKALLTCQSPPHAEPRAPAPAPGSIVGCVYVPGDGDGEARPAPGTAPPLLLLRGHTRGNRRGTVRSPGCREGVGTAVARCCSARPPPAKPPPAPAPTAPGSRGEQSAFSPRAVYGHRDPIPAAPGGANGCPAGSKFRCLGGGCGAAAWGAGGHRGLVQHRPVEQQEHGGSGCSQPSSIPRLPTPGRWERSWGVPRRGALRAGGGGRR